MTKQLGLSLIVLGALWLLVLSVGAGLCSIGFMILGASTASSTILFGIYATLACPSRW